MAVLLVADGVFGLKHYRQYLLGRKFIIRTDPAALSYLMTAKDLIGSRPGGLTPTHTSARGRMSLR